MNYITEDYFGVEGQFIEEIPIDKEEEAKKYALSLYERIRRLENGPDDDEIIRSNSNSTTSTSITFSEDSYDGELPNPTEAMKFEIVQIFNQEISVPVFGSKAARNRWTEVLEHHDARVRSVLMKLSRLTSAKAQELISEIRTINAEVEKYKPKTKSKDEMDSRKTTVRLKLIEDLIARELGSIAYTVRDLSAIVDNATSGLWATCPQSEGRKLFESLATSRIIVNYQFNFDSNQTDYLVNYLFSSKCDTRAKAKLNLAARLDKNKFTSIIQNPEKVLEIVLAEALITQEEALYLVFPKGDKGEGRVCPHCNVSVQLGPAVYHSECKVIKWLIKHCRFNYDREDSCLTPKEFMYLNAEKRRLLIELLELHAQLKRDIVKRTGSETTIWKRASNGELKKIPVRSQREDEIVGSYAWRKKHGL